MNKCFSLTMLLLIFSSISALSCDCIMHPIEKYIDTSKYIITAKVEKLIAPDINNNSTKAILIVIKTFKGKTIKKQEIKFDSDETDCAFNFKPNKEYLLFSDCQNNKFHVYHCSYSDEKNIL